MAHPTYLSNGGIAAGGDSTIAVNYPSTVNADDILIACIMDADDDGISAPNGWSYINGQSSSTNLSVAFFWKRADGTETGSATFTTASNAGSLISGIIYRFNGIVKYGKPYYLSALSGVTQTNARAVVPGAMSKGQTSFAFCIIEDNTYTSLSGSGWTEESALSTATGSDAHFILASYSGSYNGTPSTATFNSSANEYSGAIYLHFYAESQITNTLNTTNSQDFNEGSPIEIEMTGDSLNNQDLEYEIQINSTNQLVDNLDIANKTSSNGSTLTSPIGITRIAQSFQPSQSGYLQSAEFRFQKTSSNLPDGFARVSIFTHQGTFGTSSLPNYEIARSAAIPASDIPDAYDNVEFTFEELGIWLDSSKQYVVVIELTNYSAGQYSFLRSTANPYTGNGATYSSGSWTAQSTTDYYCSVRISPGEIYARSEEHLGFENTVTPADLHPFTDNNKIKFTPLNTSRLEQIYPKEYGGFSRTTGNLVTEVGGSFTGEGNDLVRATFYGNKVNNPTGNCQAILYAHTGTYGTNGTPTGSALATSDVVDVSTLPTSASYIDFEFSTPYTLVNGTNYFIIFKYDNGDGSNYVNIRSDSVSHLHGGNEAYYDTGWNTDDNSIIFKIFVAASLPSPSAEYLTDSYAFSNGNSQTNINDSITKVSQSFTAEGEKIKRIDVQLKKVGSPTGNAYIKIYAHSGTYGSSSEPTGSALATSNAFDVSTLTADWVTTSFIFDTPFQTTNGTNYCFVVEYDNGTASDVIYVRIDNLSPTHSGNVARYTTSWSVFASHDMPFEIYAEPTGTDTYYYRFRTKEPSREDRWSPWSSQRTFDYLEQLGGISGVSNGSATLTGVLTAKGALTDDAINGIATTAGVLSAKASISSSSNGVASVSGTMIGHSYMQADAVVDAATVTGVLSGKGSLVGVSEPSGLYNTEESYPVSNASSTQNVTASPSKISQSFTNVDATIKAARFELEKVGNPTGNIRAEIWSTSADVPVAVLDTSNSISLASIPSTPTLIRFTGLNIVLNGATKYALVIASDDTDSSNYIKVSTDNTSPTYAGLCYLYITSSWFVQTGHDVIFYLESGGAAFGASGTLTAKVAIDGQIDGVTTINATLSGKGSLIGSSDASTTINATIQEGGSIEPIVGQSDGVASINAVLTAKGALIGVSNPALNVSGTLQARGSLDDIIDGVATVSGILTAKGELAISSSDGVATTTAILTAKGTLSSSSDGIALLSGVLIAKGQLVGQISGVSTVAGTLQAKGTLSGLVSAISTINAILGAIYGIGTDTNSVTTIVGLLTAKGELAGESTASSTTSSLLTAKGSLASSINGQATTQGQLTSNVLADATINGIATVTATMTAKGQLAGIINGVSTITSVLAATSTLSSTISSGSTLAGVLEAKGALLSTSNGVASTQGTLQALGALEGASNGSATTDSSIIAIYGVDSDGNGIATVVGTLTAKGQLQGQINGSATVDGTIKGQGLLVGSSDGDTTVSGQLTAIGSLEATITGVASTSGTLQAIGTLLGSSNGQATTNGIIGSGAMGSTTNGVAVTTASLTAKGSLVGQSDGQATITGTLSAEGDLDGGVIQVITVSGTLTGKGQLLGVVTSQTTTQGTLVSDAMLSQANGVATVNATLSGKGGISASINGSTTTSAVAEAYASISASANGISTVQGTLIAKGLLLSAVNGVTTVSATLSASGVETGDANGLGTVQGILTAKGTLSGTSNGSTSTIGILVTDTMIGISNGTATTQGILTAKGSLTGTAIGGSSLGGQYTIEEGLEGVLQGVATVVGTMISISQIDTSCAYPVRYVSRTYLVKYLYCKFIVNYQCENKFNKSHNEEEL